MVTRRFRAPSHSCLKDSARLTSAYHHWISGVGCPTTSQYSSKASPVSLVSDIGDLTNPARKERGSRNAMTDEQGRGEKNRSYKESKWNCRNTHTHKKTETKRETCPSKTVVIVWVQKKKSETGKKPALGETRHQILQIYSLGQKETAYIYFSLRSI